MSTASIFYNYIENVEPVCVTAQEFLRTVFAEGELQKKGIQGDGKYNAMIQIGKGKFIYLHDELDSIPDYENVYSARMNYIAYAGESGEDTLARELHAFAIRVNFPERMVWQELKYLFDRHILKGQPKMRPTFVVHEGDSLIFVYVLTTACSCRHFNTFRANFIPWWGLPFSLTTVFLFLTMLCLS